MQRPLHSPTAAHRRHGSRPSPPTSSSSSSSSPARVLPPARSVSSSVIARVSLRYAAHPSPFARLVTDPSITCSGSLPDRQQDPSCPQEPRSCTWYPRGLVAPRQEGCLRAQASRGQPQGQGEHMVPVWRLTDMLSVCVPTMLPGSSFSGEPSTVRVGLRGRPVIYWGCERWGARVRSGRVVLRAVAPRLGVRVLTSSFCAPCRQDAKFRLILIESRIHRLARYYKVC